MPRLISVSYGRGVEVVINLIEAERLFGERAKEVTSRLAELVGEKCFRSLGIEPEVEESLSYVKLYSERALPQHLGFVEREAELLEARVLSRLAVETHYATVFRSSRPLAPFRVALYTVETRLPRSASFAALWSASRALRKVTRLDAVPAGRRAVCVVAPRGFRLDERLIFSTEVGSVALRLAGYRTVRPETAWGARVVKLMVNEKVRESLKERGMLVDRQKAFFDYSVLEAGPVAVRWGYEFSSAVTGEGTVAVSVSPCLSIEAREPLTEGEAEPGLRVRHLPSGLSGRIVALLGRGVCRARIGGALVEDEVSSFVRVYGMRELARMGLASEVLRTAKQLHAEWEKSVEDFASAIRRLEVAEQVLEFSKEPAPLGV